MDVGEADWSHSADVYVGYYFGRVSGLFRFPKAQREVHVIDRKTAGCAAPVRWIEP